MSCAHEDEFKYSDREFREGPVWPLLDRTAGSHGGGSTVLLDADAHSATLGTRLMTFSTEDTYLPCERLLS